MEGWKKEMDFASAGRNGRKVQRSPGTRPTVNHTRASNVAKKKKRKESHSLSREFIERTIEPLRPVDKWLTDEHRSGFGDGEKTG